MTAVETYKQRLVESNPLREPVLRAAIQALQLPEGSQGLDAGCGVGLQALLLAEAVGPHGRVTGLDICSEFIQHARHMASARGLSQRISFQEGNVHQLPFNDARFDWVWSCDMLGYPVGELLPSLLALKRVVKPGGIVAILAWSSQNLLPGYPLLEARLNADCSSLTPLVTGVPPEKHFLRALGWFRQAGLQGCRARTFVGDVQGPLDDGLRDALVSLFEMLWGQPQPGVSQEDWAGYQRLCQLGSPEFILDLPDYHAFFTYTMFWGLV